MQLATIPQNLTMTSREIAELTGKRHDNVMRDTRNMLLELYGDEGVLKFEDTITDQQNGQEYAVYTLPKRETMILVSGYSVAMRAKIIDRWQELESQQANQNFAIQSAENLEMNRKLLKAVEKIFDLQQQMMLSIKKQETSSQQQKTTKNESKKITCPVERKIMKLLSWPSGCDLLTIQEMTKLHPWEVNMYMQKMTKDGLISVTPYKDERNGIERYMVKSLM